MTATAYICSAIHVLYMDFHSYMREREREREKERERVRERERYFEVWYIDLAHRQAWCFADC